MTAYHEELVRDVEQQLLACIGCNDCLLSCPLPESREVTIAELNEAVHLPVITQPNVAGFVAACTQCRQCVPVCPADLDRATMVLFNKLKVEDAAPNRELFLQVRSAAVPSGFTLDGVSQGLAALELFKGTAPRDLRRMLLKSTLRLLVARETLCEAGDFVERLCVVLNGALEQNSETSRGRRLRILVLGPGSFFGEMAVIGGGPEPFGVRALETSIVLEIPKVAVLGLMEQSKSFAEIVGRIYSERALYSHAKKPGALGVLPEQPLLELLSSARLEQLSIGDTLIAEGERPADFFLVRSGFLRAVRRDSAGERVLVYFREGDLFGLCALLFSEPAHAYGVQAASRAEVVRIPTAALERVIARHPRLRESLGRAAHESERLARSNQIGRLPLRSAESGILAAFDPTMSSDVLVDQGLATGREVLVVDQTRCTGCGNCVAACERRHGHGRLRLDGLQVETYLFPTACRHCEDPACLLCSVNGIVRLSTGEIQIVEDNCIGCGACAERCPYDNIQMHAVDTRRRGALFRLWDLLMGAPDRDEALAALDPKLQRVAVKCDLCAGYGDYACVTACPVGAAFRIDPAKAFAGV